MLRSLRTIADGLIRLSAFFASVALIIEVLVILTDVIGRAFGRPLYGSQDLITMVMVILVMGGMALCDRQGGHIAVDLLEKKYPPALNRAVDVLSALLGAVIFGFICWSVWQSLKLSLMLNLSTNLLELPKAYFQGALIGLSAITSFGLLLRAVELTISGRDIRLSEKQA